MKNCIVPKIKFCIGYQGVGGQIDTIVIAYYKIVLIMKMRLTYNISVNQIKT